MHQGESYQDFVKCKGGGGGVFFDHSYNNKMKLRVFSQNL